MREIDLVNTITAYLERHHIRYSKEIRMGIGVPDIVITLGAPKSIIKITDYYILSLAEYVRSKRKISLKEANEYLSFEQVRFQNIINQAVDKRILAIKNGFVYCDKKIFDLKIGKAIAIEAKMEKWKSGLLQAQRYLSFADFSYLALPQNAVRNVDLELFKEKGIGLLSVTEKGLEEALSPRKSEIFEYKQKYILTSSINLDVVLKRRRDNIFSSLLNR